jgi:hypothetical protein
MKLLYELAFDRLACCGVHHRRQQHADDQVAEYLGMKEEGRLRQHLCQKDSSRRVPGMLDDEYRQERAAAHEGADRGRPPAAE